MKYRLGRDHQLSLSWMLQKAIFMIFLTSIYLSVFVISTVIWSCLPPSVSAAPPPSTTLLTPIELEDLDPKSVDQTTSSTTKYSVADPREKTAPPVPISPQDLIKTPLSLSEVKIAFDRGRNAYLYGSYKEAVKNLTPLLKPEVLIAEANNLTLAYEYIGLAHFYLGEESTAIMFFKDLIYFRPEHKLDPVRVPPNAVSLYNQLHNELQTELILRQEAMNRQVELEEDRRLKKLRQPIILEQQVNQKLIALLPFGAGQFQNREPGLGYFFLGSELIAVGLSAGFFWGIESLRQEDGRFITEDYLLAQQLQRAQLVSGGVAMGLMVSGILLALWRYQDRHDLGNYLDLNPQDQEDILPPRESGQTDFPQLTPP